MTAKPWVLVPCLVQLRAEFDQLAPGRDRGADGTIGNRAHQLESSDHNPDDTPGVRTPGHDLDHDAEVHGLDIDASGPWPAGTDFDLYAEHVRRREQAAGDGCRLQNIIWRGRVASYSWAWTWKARPGIGHYDHGHFSARYTAAAERDTRPYGLLALATIGRKTTETENKVDELVELTAACAKRIGKKPGEKIKLGLLLQYAVIAAIDGKAAVAELHDELRADGSKT